MTVSAVYWKNDLHDSQQWWCFYSKDYAPRQGQAASEGKILFSIALRPEAVEKETMKSVFTIQRKKKPPKNKQ